MKAFFSAIWKAWNKITHPINILFSSVFLTVIYVLLAPIALLTRRSDPLGRKLGAKSYWLDHRPVAPSLERCRQRF